MIRTVALGVVCLAGLGAIAAAAKKSSPPPPEGVMPVVAGNKADRLPLKINQDTSTEAEKVDVVYTRTLSKNELLPQRAGAPSFNYRRRCAEMFPGRTELLCEQTEMDGFQDR